MQLTVAKHFSGAYYRKLVIIFSLSSINRQLSKSEYIELLNDISGAAKSTNYNMSTSDLCCSLEKRKKNIKTLEIENLLNLSFLVIKYQFRYLFRSGSLEHPSDKLYNTTVEILPDQLNEESLVWQQYNTTTDGFLIIGSFNAMGLAEGVVDSRVGKLRELRLHVHSDSENWVILSEVRLEYAE